MLYDKMCLRYAEKEYTERRTMAAQRRRRMDTAQRTVRGDVKEVIRVSSVGERIRYARRNAGMGQQELARALGTTQANVSRMERGERRFTLEMLKALANVLGCPLSFLAGDEDIAPAPPPERRVSESEALFDELARKHPEVGLHLRSLAKARHELTEEDWNFLVTHLKLALGYVDASLKARRAEGSF